MNQALSKTPPQTWWRTSADLVALSGFSPQTWWRFPADLVAHSPQTWWRIYIEQNTTEQGRTLFQNILQKIQNMKKGFFWFFGEGDSGCSKAENHRTAAVAS